MSLPDVLREIPSLQINPKSGIYRGVYLAEILEVSDTAVRIAVPRDSNGRVILLAVGTALELTVPGGPRLYSEVVDRRLGPAFSLELSLPYQSRPGLIANGSSQVVTLVSGKGGVGKTTLAVNLALALASTGLKPVILDADLGTANADLFLQLQVRFTLEQVLNQDVNYRDALLEGPGGILLLPGSSGNGFDLDRKQLERLLSLVKLLGSHADVVIIDTSAGLSKVNMALAQAAGDLVLLTTPEPPSVVDTYAFLKGLAKNETGSDPHLLVNNTANPKEAQEVFSRLASAAKKFLGLNLNFLGAIAADAQVPRSVRSMQPLLLSSSTSPAARQIKLVAKAMFPLQNRPVEATASTVPQREEALPGLVKKIRAFFA